MNLNFGVVSRIIGFILNSIEYKAPPFQLNYLVSYTYMSHTLNLTSKISYIHYTYTKGQQIAIYLFLCNLLNSPKNS